MHAIIFNLKKFIQPNFLSGGLVIVMPHVKTMKVLVLVNCNSIVLSVGAQFHQHLSICSVQLNQEIGM